MFGEQLDAVFSSVSLSAQASHYMVSNRTVNRSLFPHIAMSGQCAILLALMGGGIWGCWQPDDFIFNSLLLFTNSKTGQGLSKKESSFCKGPNKKGCITVFIISLWLQLLMVMSFATNPLGTNCVFLSNNLRVRTDFNTINSSLFANAMLVKMLVRYTNPMQVS